MPRSKLKQHIHAEESRLIRRALEEHQWVMLRAAKSLEMSFSSFQRAINRHPQILADYQARKKTRNSGLHTL